MTSARRLKAWIRISLCRSPQPRSWNRWLVELEAEGLSVEEFFDLPEHRAREHLGNWPAIARALKRDAPSSTELENITRRMEQNGVRLIAINDPLYPRALLCHLGFDAPSCLYVSGSLRLLRAPSVAIVGTREPSPLGLETASAYAGELGARGIHVISGNARGIDTAAHKGALSSGGSTTFVLPCGIFALSEGQHLARVPAVENSLVVSQFPPEGAGERDMPIRRNSTLAALADGLIVVESGLIGGTSYSFRKAKELRKPLWAVIYPEPVPPSAAGNHSLLAAGARPLPPGKEGAREACDALAEELREAHTHRPKAPCWPPAESPGQGDLFA